MATWMTHIRIADIIMKKLPELALPEFVIGSISPDCGRINPDGVSYVPDKSVTHFGRYREGREYDRLLSLAVGDKIPFFLGYYAHILTDDLWIKNVLLPKKFQYLKEFPDFYHFIMGQRANWFYLDKEYILAHPENAAYGLFDSTGEFDNIYLDFQPRDGLTEHICKVKAQYAKPLDTGVDRRFLDAHELEGFITYAEPIVTAKLKAFFDTQRD